MDVLDGIYTGLRLPPGFAFPEDFRRLVAEKDFDRARPWWILAEEPDAARSFYRRLNYDMKLSKALVPFAKNDEDGSGDLACFDGEDVSGNPRIFFWTGPENHSRFGADRWEEISSTNLPILAKPSELDLTC